LSEECNAISDDEHHCPEDPDATKRHGAGWVFSAKHLSDRRMAAFVGLARRLYDAPRIHPVLGPLSPHPDAVAVAAAEQAAYRIQTSPARAGQCISSQAPAKIVYLTDGSSRQIQIAGGHLPKAHWSAAPLGAGTPAGAARQALRAIGRDNVNDTVVRQLRANLPPEAKPGLRKFMHKAPLWMAPVIAAITA
jgi:hypothetical protein